MKLSTRRLRLKPFGVLSHVYMVQLQYVRLYIYFIYSSTVIANIIELDIIRSIRKGKAHKILTGPSTIAIPQCCSFYSLHDCYRSIKYYQCICLSWYNCLLNLQNMFDIFWNFFTCRAFLCIAHKAHCRFKSTLRLRLKPLRS